MPIYTFIDKQTGEETTQMMSISQLDKFCKKNAHLEQVIGAPAIGDSVRLGFKKPDSAFRDHLKEIKKKHSGGFTKSTVNTF
jgi:predicted nucleic acid-binding Zn ribbon protein